MSIQNKGVNRVDLSLDPKILNKSQSRIGGAGKNKTPAEAGVAVITLLYQRRL